MSEELKACPFCGSADVDAENWTSSEGRSGPGCMDCGATAESVNEWNRRAIDAVIEKIRDRLKSNVMIDSYNLALTWALSLLEGQ